MQEELRHLQFVEYLNKMGMAQYGTGTVLYYEDELDRKKLNNDSSYSSGGKPGRDLDYDL